MQLLLAIALLLGGALLPSTALADGEFWSLTEARVPVFGYPNRVPRMSARFIGEFRLAGRSEGHSVIDMVRAFARRTGYRGWIPALNVPGPQMSGMRAGKALPGADADLGRQTFAEWLAAR